MSSTRKKSPLFDLSGAIAERKAKRNREPLRFEFEGRLWEMIDPGDAPSAMYGWRPSDFVRHLPDLLVPQVDEAGEPVLFPLADLSADGADALIAAWIGGTPGE